jgi:peroxiredoxin
MMGRLRWRPSRRGLLRFGRDALIVALVYAAVFAWKGRDMAEGPAPGLRAMDIAGQSVDLAALRGRPVLVQFWGTWCPICRMELGSLQTLSQDWQVVTVAMQSGQEHEIRAFMREHGLDYTVISDPDGAIARRWGVSAVPAGFVLGPAGTIRFRVVGLTSLWGLRARLWWAGL